MSSIIRCNEAPLYVIELDIKMKIKNLLLGFIFTIGALPERSNAQALASVLTFGGCEQHMSGSRYQFKFDTNSRNYIETWLSLRFLDQSGRLILSSAPIVRAKVGEPFIIRFSGMNYCDEWSYIIVSEIPQNNSAFPDFYFFGTDLQLESLSSYCYIDYCFRRAE